MTTNDNTGNREAECGCKVAGLHRYGCAGVGHVDPPRPATPDAEDASTSASEPLGLAERSALRAIFAGRSTMPGGLIETVERIVAARQAKARAEAGEQALLDAADVPTPGPAVMCASPKDRDDQWRHMLRARAARIARSVTR